ncbi:MAG: phytoene/squalene synthase family protein [Paracoccaceae bacterium]
MDGTQHLEAALAAPVGLSREADLAHCAAAIRHGSRSFHAASKLLPRRVREPALALYAFCRLADDAVDEAAGPLAAKAEAARRLRLRLDACYRGAPENHPADRAMAAIVEAHEMPKALPLALIEGLEWDAEGRRYRTLSDLHAYSARVAGAVGAMMTVLMGVRDRDALARACDLGNAMQLTNIARDVGEDARAGRLFLPLDWLEEAGIEPERLLAEPRFSPELGAVTARLLREARRLYRRAAPGVAALPADCRPAIYAAARIYGAIGAVVRAQGHDSVSRRAVTTTRAKLGRAALALGDAALSLAPGRPLGLSARPLAQTAFLVEAAAKEYPASRHARAERQVSAFIAVIAELEARDRDPMRPA